eukprot:5386381-Prymnesium_polylepis.1
MQAAPRDPGVGGSESPDTCMSSPGPDTHARTCAVAIVDSHANVRLCSCLCKGVCGGWVFPERELCERLRAP